MKTCYVCKKEYEYVSPLYAIVKSKNGVRRISNFCNMACSHQFILAPPEMDSAKIAYYPFGHITMCQFCGSFTHPPEYCTIYGTDKEAQKNFQKIGNCLGEHAYAKGSTCIGHIGEDYQVEADMISYTGVMVKTLPDKMLRNELLYFWDNDAFVQHHVNDIMDNNEESVAHTKEFITNLNIVPAKSEAKTIFMVQLTTAIHNPHKLFFPFDINDENCWFPIHKEKETKRVIITCDKTINNCESIYMDLPAPEIFEVQEELKPFD